MGLVPELASKRHPIDRYTDALRIYFDKFGLQTEVDSVVAGVLLGDCDEALVGAACPFNSRRTCKRRKASARIPSASVSGASLCSFRAAEGALDGGAVCGCEAEVLELVVVEVGDAGDNALSAGWNRCSVTSSLIPCSSSSVGGGPSFLIRLLIRCIKLSRCGLGICVSSSREKTFNAASEIALCDVSSVGIGASLCDGEVSVEDLGGFGANPIVASLNG